MSSCLVQSGNFSSVVLLYPKSFILLVKGDYNYIIVPGLSLKASLLHSWQCPAKFKLHSPRIVQHVEVLKEKVPEVF